MDSNTEGRRRSLQGRRLLVTGASGFIGSRLCRRAVEDGAILHGVSRRHHGDGGGVRWERVDLTDAAATSDLMRRVQPDVVIHLASEVSGGRDIELVLPMLRANLLATVHVMLACAEAGCGRVVLAGSMEEPDVGDKDSVAQSPYAAAKWGALAYARHLYALHGLPVVHLRVFMVYGPGQLDLHKLVPYVTVSLLRDEEPKLTSGDRRVDWIYVDDVVDAFLKAAFAPGLEGRSLDVGSGQLIAVRDLVGRLSSLIEGSTRPAFGAVSDRLLERSRVADCLPSWEAMHWRPETPLEVGLTRTVEFYRSNLEHLPPIQR